MKRTDHTPVTDLDYFVGLGHSEKAVREALLLARGDRNTALFYLAKAGVSKDRGQLSWRKQSSNDWVEGISKVVPTIAENRALHQSPVYIFVQDFYPGDDGEYVYRMQVTLKDGRQYMLGRTFPEFYSFYNSLPFGSVRGLTKGFPAPQRLQFLFGDNQSRAFHDKRLEGLNEWMRDLVLNEDCMSNVKLLELLFAFIEAEALSGEKSVPVATILTPQKLTSPLLLETQDSTQAAFLKRKSFYFNQAALLGPEQLPISVHQATHMLPVKVNVKKLQCYHDLIGIKKSAESKTEEDALHREEENEEDAELKMALAASAAEAQALLEEEAQLDAAIQASMQSLPANSEPSGERFDEATSPLHFLEGPASSVTSVEEEYEYITKPSAESAQGDGAEERETSPHPTYCSPPLQPVHADNADAADKPLPAQILSRMQSSSMLGFKIDTIQLQKDCSRDRIVVQGKRLDGAHTDLEYVYTLGRDSILQAMALAGKSTSSTASPMQGPTPGLTKVPSTTNPFDLDDSLSPVESSGTIARPPTGPIGPKGMLLTDEELAAELQRAELRERSSSSLSPTSSRQVKNPFAEDAEGVEADSVAHTTAINISNRATNGVSKLHQDCEQLSRVALSLLSRSESGYLSHASLHEIFDMENFHQVTDFKPFFFVPEATLSDPLQLTFTILEKGSGAGGVTQAARGKYAQPALAEEWCVECTGETSTVYRLMDAVSLEPLLQIRVMYQVTLFGMPQYKQGSSTEVTGLLMREGKCQVLIDKVTTTTSRDWSGPK